MNTDLGHPLPPDSVVRCPLVFFREFDLHSTANSLVPRYAFDLDAHTAPDGVVMHERYSQSFMTSLLRTLQSCLSHAQYTAQTHHLGATVLNRFLEGIESSHRVGSRSDMSCVRVDNCLDPETSISQSVLNARNDISIICEDCLTR